MNTVHHLQNTIGGVLATATGRDSDPRRTPLGRVVTDSRKIRPGDVFWALAGPKYDGTDFARDAFGRGAAGAVVGRSVDAPGDRWLLTVNNTLEGLQRWATHNREHFTGTVIGVTGSVGKTTTRQMIHTVLKSRLFGSASPRNYNNHVGLPLSMLRIDPRHDYAVLELGASRQGEITSLAEMCSPEIGVITQIGDAHLGGFGSRLGVAEAKVELLAALPPDGHAVLGDDPLLRRFAHRCKAPITWVGRGSECDVRADEVRFSRGKLEFRVDDCPFSVPVWGRHYLSSAMVAIAVGQIMGFDPQDTAKALVDFDPLPMRCQVMQIRGATIINDTYNASPMAMRAALELLRDFDSEGRRIIVSGDMGELGTQSITLHQKLGNQVVTVCGADLLIACGRFAHHVVTAARAAGMPKARSIPCSTPEESLPYLGQAILPGDVVLVKGSRVLEMERVVDALHQYPRRRSA